MGFAYISARWVSCKSLGFQNGWARGGGAVVGVVGFSLVREIAARGRHGAPSRLFTAVHCVDVLCRA